jgi:peptide/nickel transport system ATP-binding protein
MSLLEIKNLDIDYLIIQGRVRAVNNASFSMKKGETLGIIGESGCGKTTLILSLMKLLPPAGLIAGGEILFKGEDLTLKSEDEMEKLRWKEISMVFQGALNYLNPIRTAGQQIVEGILTHEHNRINKKEAWSKAEELLELVRIPISRAKSYPHELSGGMKQRVMMAMALSLNPDLVIFDEPMTALDVVVQAQIINLMKNLQTELNLSVILVTHNWNIISEMTNNCLVMYAGKIVEYNNTISLYRNPIHPYTQALLRSIPSIRGTKKFSFQSIPGAPPNLTNLPVGCRFNPRCPYAFAPCYKKEPEPTEINPGHYVACHKAIDNG